MLVVAVLSAIVLIFACAVRMLDLSLLQGTDGNDVWADESGLPYFMDPDSAYYVRISKEIAERGQYGTADPETGQLIDTLQYAPDEIKNSRKSRTRRKLAGWRWCQTFGFVIESRIPAPRNAVRKEWFRPSLSQTPAMPLLTPSKGVRVCKLLCIRQMMVYQPGCVVSAVPPTSGCHPQREVTQAVRGSSASDGSRIWS